MIRIVLSVLLAAAMIAIALPAVDHGAEVNGESEGRQIVADVEDAATSLIDEEQLPPTGVRGAQRSLTVTFPSKSRISAPVQTLTIERIDDRNVSVVEFNVKGEGRNQIVVDAPIVNPEGGAVELGGTTGEVTLVLYLARDPTDDSDEPVVVLRRTSRR